MKNVAMSILVLFAVTWTGCGPSYDVVPVEGVLTYEGEPVPDMVISAKPADAMASVASTGPDGSFQLRYKRMTMGVVPGVEHEITANWSPPTDDGSAQKSDIQKAVEEDFQKNGPIKATFDKPTTDFEIKLPR